MTCIFFKNSREYTVNIEFFCAIVLILLILMTPSSLDILILQSKSGSRSRKTNQTGYLIFICLIPKGLTICERIKALSGAEKIRLFLFTADEQEDIRKMAYAAGVEKVVVKSQAAGEIVGMGSQHLSWFFI